MPARETVAVPWWPLILLREGLIMLFLCPLKTLLSSPLSSFHENIYLNLIVPPVRLEESLQTIK